MKYPTRRYGNPEEFRYYSSGWEIKDLARFLRRSERSIRDWLNYHSKMPWWVSEIMRFNRLEADIRMRQMHGRRLQRDLQLIHLEDLPSRHRDPQFVEDFEAPAAANDPLFAPGDDDSAVYARYATAAGGSADVSFGFMSGIKSADRPAATQAAPESVAPSVVLPAASRRAAGGVLIELVKRTGPQLHTPPP